MTETENNARILLKAALSFMAQKANVTETEIRTAIENDPTGTTACYFAQLIAIGIPAIATH